VYIDPKDERKTYQKILKDENYHPIPSKLIYSPIIKQEIEDLKQEIEDLLKDKVTDELPSLYPNTHLYWLKGDVLFFQGLPGAAFTGIFIEELIALGVTEIIFLGLAGGIQSAIIGDKFIVTEALRYEKENMQCKKGKICSTDAPFRETFELVSELKQKQVVGIEMEISAVYAIAQFRKIQAVALVVISDELKDEGWSQFQPKIYLKEFISCIELLIEFFSRY
jgi:purine-nucleoside phosphorylase